VERGDPDGAAKAVPEPLPEPKDIDAFLPFLHSDLMLLTGLIEALERLFLPSSVESSEKRLDGAGDGRSIWLTMLLFWLRKSGEFGANGDGDEVLCVEENRPKGSGDNGITGEPDPDDAGFWKDGEIIPGYVGP
jgi:hypothetical protein